MSKTQAQGKGLGSLTKGALVEIKAMNNPPVVVKDILHITLLLLGYPNDRAKDWKVCKQAMGKMTFLDDLARLDASTIPADNVSKANEMAKGLSVASAKKVSCAASELLTWCEEVLKIAPSHS